MEKSCRIVYFDYLRVFATFAVIILHISAQNWYSANVNGFEWHVFNVFDSAVRWCVPVFVMISGALFIDKDLSVRMIYSKYVLRLAVAFVVWSAIYSYFAKGSLTNKFFAFVKGHYHMWFILMIACLYMCIPIIKLIAYDKSKSIYYLVLALFFTFVVPESLTLLNDLGGEMAKKLADALSKDVSNMYMHFVLGYTFYFLLGYYLNKISISKKLRLIIYLLGFANIFIIVKLNSIVALKTQAPCGHYYSNFYIHVLLEAIAVFVFFKHRRFSTEKYYAIIQKLSKYSFGAYIVHPLIIEQLNIHLRLNTMSFNPILAVLCLSVIVFIVSFVISAILNSIPFVNKYLV